MSKNTLKHSRESRNDTEGNSDGSFPCPAALSARKDSCHTKAMQQRCSVLTTTNSSGGSRCSRCILQQVKRC